MKAKFALLYAAVLVMITRQADSAVVAPTLTVSPAVTASTTNVEVDVGIPVTFTCTKAGSGTEATVFKFFQATTEIVSGGTGVTLSSSTPWTYKQVTASANNDQVIKCNAALAADNKDSNTFTLKVTAIPVPTLTSDQAANTTGTIPTICVAVGATVKFTCAKATGTSAAKQDPVEYKFLNGGTAVTTGISAAVWTHTVVVADNGKEVTCEHWNSATAKKASKAIKILVKTTPMKPTVTGFKAVPKEKESMALTCVSDSGLGCVVDKNFEWYQTIGTAAEKKVTSTGTLMATLNFTVTKDHKDNSFRCRGENAQGFGVYSDMQKITSVTDVAATQVISLLTMWFALAVSAAFRD